MHQDQPKRLIGDFEVMKMQVTRRAGSHFLSIQLLSLKSQAIHEINVGQEFIKSDRILFKSFKNLMELNQYLDYEFSRLETTDNGDIIFNVKTELQQVKVVLPAERREKSDLELSKRYTDKLIHTRVQQLTKLFEIRLQELQHRVTKKMVQLDNQSSNKMKKRIDSRVTQVVKTLEAVLAVHQDIKLTQGKFEENMASLNLIMQKNEQEIEEINLKLNKAEAKVGHTKQQLNELLIVIQKHVEKSDQQKIVFQREMRLINQRLNSQLDALRRQLQEFENKSLQNRPQMSQKSSVKKQIIKVTYEDIFYELLSIEENSRVEIKELLISAAV